jgi:outer membrane protein OmpA-like peptidoglycan-associated protein/tetratricopeptide (TPR) repeat protein
MTPPRIVVKRSIYIIVVLMIASCTFSKKIKDGETAYERKQYAVAAELLMDEYAKVNSDLQKARKAWLLANVYTKLLEYEDAITWMKKAVSHNYGAEALAGLGKLQKVTEDYSGAIETYQKLAAVTGKKQESDRDIQISKQALDYKNRRPEYQVERIFENSSVSDYAPALFENQYLVFSSERKDATSKDIYNWTGEHFSDLFLILKSGSEVKRFDSAINTPANEGSAWFTSDMQTMYFTRCYSFGSGDEFCKILTSERVDGVWSDPEAMPFTQDKVNYGQPTLIENDSILVFASDLEEPGGTSDLYYSELNKDGSWSSPEKFPATINSQGNEKFPTGDGDTLYFSSDYWPGMGGYDIFKTYLRKDGSWSVPYNMAYPINSGGDDFSFLVDYSAKPRNGIVQQGYFSSSRMGSGKDDIFRFSKLKVDPSVPEVVKPEVKKTIFLTVSTFTNIFNTEDDPNSGIKAKSRLGECLIKITDSDGKKVSDAYTDGNGFYYTDIPEDEELSIIGAKLGYLNTTAIVSTKNIVFSSQENSKTLNLDLILDKIYTDKEINLDNIYYDYDKWDIKSDAKPTLDALMKILKDNPQIKVQLSSHTDCRGDEAYNMDLSQKRAQSVVDYLTSQGIRSDRMVAKGYGESQLINPCKCEDCTEQEHLSNRRTTFKIVK